MTEAPDATENKKLFENQEVLAASEKIITRGHEQMCLSSKKCRRSNMKVHFLMKYHLMIMRTFSRLDLSFLKNFTN